MIKENKKVLLVEDDLNLGFLIQEYLENIGFEVKMYRDGETAFKGFQLGTYDICLLDIMLPKMDGFELAKRMKEINKNTPIIFLTAKSLKEDKLKGFALGVDDYITKPFDEEELVCRIKAVLMRTKPTNNCKENFIYEISDYTFNSEIHLLTNGNQSKRLTLMESKILLQLCLSINKLVFRETLLIDIWGENDYFKGRSLDVFITKLRKYLKEDSRIKIETVPKIGFILSVS